MVHKLRTYRKGEEFKYLLNENYAPILETFFIKELTIEEAYKKYKSIGGKYKESLFYDLYGIYYGKGYFDHYGKDSKNSKKGNVIIKLNLKSFFDYLKNKRGKISPRTKRLLELFFENEEIRKLTIKSKNDIYYSMINIISEFLMRFAIGRSEPALPPPKDKLSKLIKSYLNNKQSNLIARKKIIQEFEKFSNREKYIDYIIARFKHDFKNKNYPWITFLRLEDKDISKKTKHFCEFLLGSHEDIILDILNVLKIDSLNIAMFQLVKNEYHYLLESFPISNNNDVNDLFNNINLYFNDVWKGLSDEERIKKTKQKYQELIKEYLNKGFYEGGLKYLNLLKGINKNQTLNFTLDDYKECCKALEKRKNKIIQKLSKYNKKTYEQPRRDRTINI